MSRFTTLLQREWMQHHRGYLVMMLAPPALGLLLVAFANRLQIEPDDPLGVMLGAAGLVTGAVLALAWGAMVFQLPGLARRDRQDRSIEFWLSMPVSHSQSIGATLLAHGLLVPLIALGVGFVCSQVTGFALVGATAGTGGWLAVPWMSLVPAEFAVLLRTALGVVLATLWLSPLLLAVMAASAWLKRWGTAALVAGLGFGHLLLGRLYGITAIGDTVYGLVAHAKLALFHSAAGGADGMEIETAADLAAWVARAPGWAADDAALALRQLADPLLLVALLVSAGCFALLVLRRRRG